MLVKKYLIFALVLCVIQGCTTAEFRTAKNQCAGDAYREYPINNVPTVVTRTQPVQVPTGQTNCSTTYLGVTANTTCNQVMTTEFRNYQETVIVDTNANSREITMQRCAARLCYSRYGNAECKVK